MPLNESESPRQGTFEARRAIRENAPPGAYRALLPRRLPRAFSWLDARALWVSRNDRVARLLGDPTNALRRRWMAWLRHNGRDDLTVREFADRERVRFVVIGDTGEGDMSQWVAVPPLMAAEPDADFAVICSDVIYPTGDVNEYPEKFYKPYAGWGKPLFGLPGNHDWYEELHGFMYHLCGVEPPPPSFQVEGLEIHRPPLWRPPRKRREGAERARSERPPGRIDQPGPYFAIDAGPVALVCIDTGILGDLDREQGRWLAQVSREIRKPKVLLTGKPLIVDGQYRPGVIEGRDSTVDDIFRNPAHGYVATVGGDIHNYQRYPVDLGDRCLEYIVAGGGGAFMHATHRIGRVDLTGVTEDRFRSFPLRGDSLVFYARTLVPALRRMVVISALLPLLLLALTVGAGFALDALFGGGAWPWVVAGAAFLGPFVSSLIVWQQISASGAPDVISLAGVHLTPEQASSWMGEKLEHEPTVSDPVEVGPRQRALLEFVYPRLHAAGGFLQEYVSEIFDVDTPPMYKQFLSIEADPDTLTITCCAAIGTEANGQPPFVEEWVRIPLAPARAAMGIQ